jgi:glycosyltransferase 2 family protein
MKLSLKTIVGIIGIIIAITYCIRGVNFKDVIKILREMNPILTAMVFCLTSLNLVIRARVFKLIVYPIKKISTKQALSSYLVGVFSNLFLPFKLGDVAQGYFLGSKQDISKISAVSAVFVQRVFEVTTLLLFMIIVGIVFSFPLLLQEKTLIIGVSIFLGITLLFVAFKKRDVIGAFIQKLVSRYSPSLAETIRRYIELLFHGASAIHDLHAVLRIGAFSMLSWVIQVVMVKYTADALNISIDFVASSTVLFIVNLGLIIPIAPGNIGTFQFFGILALSLFSVPKPQALIFSIIFQVIQGIPVILGGGLILTKEVLLKKKNGSSRVCL